jgi:hypothetical protein
MQVHILLLAVVLLVLATATAAFAQSTTPETFGGWFVPSKSRGYYHNCQKPPCIVPPPELQAPKAAVPQAW